MALSESLTRTCSPSPKPQIAVRVPCVVRDQNITKLVFFGPYRGPRHYATVSSMRSSSKSDRLRSIGSAQTVLDLLLRMTCDCSLTGLVKGGEALVSGSPD
jgi:hypothetical protein